MRYVAFTTLSATLALAACSSSPPVGRPDSNVRFFKLQHSDPPHAIVAVEFWQETPDFLFLYADLLLDSVHYEVVQFVKFNANNEVEQTRHFLFRSGRATIDGGIVVQNQVVKLQDTYGSHRRTLELPFVGPILHPARLEKFLIHNQKIDLKGATVGFVDWRAPKPFIDEFKIKKNDRAQYDLPMKTGIQLRLELVDEHLSRLRIIYTKQDKKPDLELIPATLKELEDAPSFNFNYLRATRYLHAFKGFQ